MSLRHERLTNLPIDTSTQSRFLTRRRVTLLTAAVAAAAVTNHFGGELVWKSEPTHLKTLPYDGPPSTTAGIVVPGLGGLNGKKMAEQISKAIPIPQPWGYLQYNNKDGITIDEVTAGMKSYQQEVGFNYMDLYGPSMGLLLGLEAARRADIPIRNICANSSPFDMQDGYGSKIGEFIVEHIPYDFKLAGKFVGTLLANSVRKGLKKTPSNLLNAFVETGKGASPALFKSQVQILKNIQLDWEAFADIIDPTYTQAIYLSPRGNNDDVVNVVQAYPKLQTFFNSLGVNLEFAEMPEAEHADTTHAMRHGKQWFEKVYGVTENIIFSQTSALKSA